MPDWFCTSIQTCRCREGPLRRAGVSAAGTSAAETAALLALLPSARRNSKHGPQDSPGPCQRCSSPFRSATMAPFLAWTPGAQRTCIACILPEQGLLLGVGAGGLQDQIFEAAGARRFRWPLWPSNCRTSGDRVCQLAVGQPWPEELA